MLNGVQDPSGDPPPLVWPSFLRPTPPFQLVYLDLNHWISLAQAATGHSDGARFVQVLAACREARRAGVAIFPLSNSHYVEISKIKDPRQRQDLAHVIEELSDFITLLSPAALKKIELDAVLQEPLGSLPSRWNNYPLVGYGVGFSLGRPMRPQLVGRDGEDVTEQWRQLPGGDELLRNAAVGLERAVWLAQPTPKCRNLQQMAGTRKLPGGWPSHVLRRNGSKRCGSMEPRARTGGRADCAT